ncbi:hypothetical protein DBR44_15605 [Aquitalea sp. FJL05]|nr:hypothetical protein DBR44_15605 [Aquitalea sp. FJL05]
MHLVNEGWFTLQCDMANMLNHSSTEFALALRKQTGHSSCSTCGQQDFGKGMISFGLLENLLTHYFNSR